MAAVIAEKRAVYINRELSQLNFNERVLKEASEELPLIERYKFAAIYASNMDEFFMVRAASLINRRLEDDGKTDSRTAMRPGEQLSLIYKEAMRLTEQKDLYTSAVERELAERGVRRLDMSRLSAQQLEQAENYYSYSIKPFLKVSYHEESEPPFLEGKKPYCALRLKSAVGVRTAIVNCRGKFDDMVMLKSENDRVDYLLAEDLILANADRLFPNEQISERVIIRAVRSADIHVENLAVEGLDRRGAMKKLVEQREKLPAVRLQLSGEISELFKAELCIMLSISSEQVFIERTPLDMAYVFRLAEYLIGREDMFYNRFTPAKPLEDIFVRAREQDILLSYPYENFISFVKLLESAAVSEEVLSIKITLYRVAKDSKIVSALCEAAKRGKSVTVCTELRARFDEERNLESAAVLEAAGCKVLYGPRTLKVHSKLCLISYRRDGVLLHITQIGTGNYNENTAVQYTDFSLITADPNIAEDAERVFTRLEHDAAAENSYTLLIAPNVLRSRVIELLDVEIKAAKCGSEAYFGAKLNGLSDKVVMDKLIEASAAGVKIELIVRGICCLRPGISGYTENIRIVSIVGRFLEHSRIYIFGCGERQKVYISSADLMTRNTCRRIEAAAPLNSAEIKQRVTEYFRTQFSDAKAYELMSNGKYLRRSKNEPCAQEIFMAQIPQPISPDLPETPPPEEPVPLPPDAEENNTEDIITEESTELLTEKPDPIPDQPPKKKGFFARIIDFFRRRR